MKKEISGSVNLLSPVEPPQDSFTILYDWSFSVGKIILVLVQIIVIIVFASRLYLDKVNNDLTRSINEQISFLSSPEVQEEEERYRRLHSFFSDISIIDTDHHPNALLIISLIDSFPEELIFSSFGFNQYKANFAFEADEFEHIRKYESMLKRNPHYKNVAVNLVKELENLEGVQKEDRIKVNLVFDIVRDSN